MLRMICHGGLALAALATPLSAPSRFATTVTSFNQGTGGGIFTTSNALDGPQGGGLALGSLDVLSLGLGGDVTLGFDVTVRHRPGTSAFYQGSVVGSEWYWNDQEFFAPGGSSERFRANGGYAYLESFFGRQFSGGLLFDHAENVAGPTDRQDAYSLFVTWRPSEFQRLRLQLDQIDQIGKNDQRVWLPFAHAGFDGSEARIAFGADRALRRGRARQPVAHGDAGALGAVVESQKGLEMRGNGVGGRRG